MLVTRSVLSLACTDPVRPHAMGLTPMNKTITHLDLKSCWLIAPYMQNLWCVCVCVCMNEWESIEFLYWFLHLKQRQSAPWCHFNTFSWPGAAVRLQSAASNSLCQQESGGCNQLPPLKLFKQSRGNEEPWEWCSVPWLKYFNGFVFIVFQHLNPFVKVYPGKWVITPNDLFSSWEFFHSTKTGPVWHSIFSS